SLISPISSLERAANSASGNRSAQATCLPYGTAVSSFSAVRFSPLLPARLPLPAGVPDAVAASPPASFFEQLANVITPRVAKIRPHRERRIILPGVRS